MTRPDESLLVKLGPFLDLSLFFLPLEEVEILALVIVISVPCLPDAFSLFALLGLERVASPLVLFLVVATTQLPLKLAFWKGKIGQPGISRNFDR